MKKILALLLVIAMAVLMLSACGKTRSITANNLPKGKVLLSSLSQEELVKFLEERNIAIYEPYMDEECIKLLVDLIDIANLKEIFNNGQPVDPIIFDGPYRKHSRTNYKNTKKKVLVFFYGD